MKLRTGHFLLALLAVFCMAGCNTDETEIGLNLQDPSTIYQGVRDTLYADIAMSVRDDSLLTSGYSMGIVGNYSDTAFGKMTSVIYSQVALPNSTGITFDESSVIDSVVLTLATHGFFPGNANSTYNLHFEIKQLAEQVYTDSSYYSTDVRLTNESMVFYSDSKNYSAVDSIISFRMSDDFKTLLQGRHTEEEFLENMKGIRIRILDSDSDPCMVTVNWAAAKTCMTVYYHFVDNPADSLTYTLKVGEANHFTNFTHDYTGTTLGADSLAGLHRLYFEPLGGYNLKLGFANAVAAFREAHPYAAIHYAELLLPLTADSDSDRPDRILASRYMSDGSVFPIDDLIDTYTYSGFDGSYDTVRNCYRMRVTMHTQMLLRDGEDRGLLLTLNSRRHMAQRAVVAGPLAANPVRIEFIYSE